MSSKDFERYVKYKLETIDYDPEGLSACAIMASRRKGLHDLYFKSFKRLCKDVVLFIREFKGVDTPLSWFALLLFSPFVIVVSIFTRPHYTYNKACRDFKIQYSVDVQSGRWVKEEKS